MKPNDAASANLTLSSSLISPGKQKNGGQYEAEQEAQEGMVTWHSQDGRSPRTLVGIV